jgi:hypothetical protein
MNDEDLTETAPVQGPYPPRRRWKRLTVAAMALGVVGVLAGVGIALASGGGSGGPGVAHVGSSATPATAGSSGGSSGSDRDKVLAFSKCMREHGISDFPDPDSKGGLGLNANGPNSDLAQDNPAFQAANQACKQLLPNGGQPTQVDPADHDKILAYAKCMREHGIADFPDPPANGPLQLSPTQGGDLDPTNPQYKAADTACKHLLPGGGKGGSTNTQTAR